MAATVTSAGGRVPSSSSAASKVALRAASFRCRPVCGRREGWIDALAEGFAGKFWPHVRCLKAALPQMRPDGSVTVITAVSARAALPGTAGLAAINGALELMIGPLAIELAPLRVNAVSPGVIDTPWWAGVPDSQREAMFAQFAAVLPGGRVGHADEVAQAVVFAAGNGHMTGSVIECAGGAQLATDR